MIYTVYIFRSNSNYLYIGQTDNLPRRLQEQLSISDHAAKFIKDRGDFRLMYKEEYSTLAEAMRREKQLKGWTRAKKEALIMENLELLKRL